MADYAIHDTTLIGTSSIIRKKEGSSALIDPADYPKRINLMGMLEEKSASSASVCSFSDGADDVPMSSVVAHIAPTLTGTNAVNMVQSGKNLFDKANPNVVDGYISTTAFNTGNANAKTIYIPIKSGETYTVSKTAGQRFQIATSDVVPSNNAVFTSRQAQSGSQASLTITAGANDQYLWAWVFLDGTDTGTLADMLASVQIEYGSTATAYEPYTEPTSYTANLGRTVYGADVDLVSGNCEPTNWLDDTLANLEQGSINGSTGANENANNRVRTASAIPFPYDEIASSYTWTIPSGYKVAIRPYDANGNFVQLPSWALAFITQLPQDLIGQGVTQMRFVLAKTDNSAITPSDMAEVGYVLNKGNTAEAYSPYFAPFTFDGQEIPSLLGVNNLWHDDGETEAVYRSSGTVTPVPVVPTLISKTITDNGTYSAEDDDADGYSEVTVNVQGGGEEPFVPQFTETKIADNSSHASSFTLSEDYANYDMVKIVWYESATVSGFLYTTPDILDEIFSVGVGKLCINKPSTNYYVCYTKSGLTWTQSNQRNISVLEIYGVTFTNCTMTATDLYKRGASTTTKYAVTSQTSLKDYDLFMMASIHATDGSETMPTTWLYQYPKENMSEAFSCPVPAVLQEYNANDEAFVISEYGMTSARYFMVQGITFTPTPSLLSMSPSPTPSEPDSEDPEEVEEEET